jgi:ankyrin repeat protein
MAMVELLRNEHDLIVAAEGNNLPSVEKALAAGAKVNHQTASEKMMALHMAAGNGNAQMVDCLLGHGADVRILDSKGRTPAVVAIEFGFYELAGRLTDLECQQIQKEQQAAPGKSRQ